MKKFIALLVVVAFGAAFITGCPSANNKPADNAAPSNAGNAANK